MAPRRKHKATKAKTNKPTSKTKAGGIGTSSTKRKYSSQATRPSRLQPSEPLHMSLRAASKAASNATASPAAALSVAGTSSRRSSLNSVVQVEAVEEDLPSSDAENGRPAWEQENGLPPSQQPSHTATPVPEVNNDAQSWDAQNNVTKAASSPTCANSEDPEPPTKKRKSSGASLPSEQSPNKTVNAQPNVTTPLKKSSKNDDANPPRKKRKVADAQPDSAEQPPELTDSSTPPGSPENVPEVQINAELPISATNGDAATTKAANAKRLPGRRRQPHSDVNIETDLRRQLTLKMGYRSIAKALKPVLAELAARSLKGIEEDPLFHTESPEHERVTKELNQRLQNRKTFLDNERRIKLDQLERVTVASEEILRTQFRNRFEQFQEDYILRCQHQLMQLEREIAAEEGDATDDEDNIVPPTRKSYVPHSKPNIQDENTYKYESRSRAYIETDRMWDLCEKRRKLDYMRSVFMQENEEFDDAVDNLPGGFASYIGPDREPAMAAYNINTLADAAKEVETAPVLSEPPKVIRNEEATALYILASLSSEKPPEAAAKTKTPQNLPQSTPQVRAITPAQNLEPHRQPSPSAGPPSGSTAMSLETARSSPVKPPNPVEESPAHAESNGAQEKEPITVKEEAPVKVSGNKIQDLLNNDQDMPSPRRREPRTSGFSEQVVSSSPMLWEKEAPNQVGQKAPQTIASSPRLLASAIQRDQKVQQSPMGMKSILHSEDQPLSRKPVTPSTEPARPALSPNSHDQFWSSKRLKEKTPDGHLPKRNPLARIKHMLDVKQGKNPSEGASNKPAHIRSDSQSSRRDSFDRTDMGPPGLINQRERSASITESRRPSLGQPPAASPSTVPVQSNIPVWSNTPRYAHRASQQHAPLPQMHPHWENDRRMSGPQQRPQTPSGGYQPHQPQPYPQEYHQGGPPQPHQQQLPAYGQPLPPKPNQPTPQNYRFAHYEPAQQQRGPPQPPPQQYIAVAHPQGPPPPPPGSQVVYGAPPPHPHQSPYPGAPGPSGPPLQFAPPYSGPPTYGHPAYNAPPPPYQVYQPPPQGYGAPPPPPQGYAPLKVHQYGGTPILPANIQPHPSQAPIPQPPPPGAYAQGPPPPPVYGQPPPQQQPQYEVQQGPPPQQPQYEMRQGSQGPPGPPPQQQATSESAHSASRGGPQPRRRYRSHAPVGGHEFKNYTGPNPPRRRGGDK
ncbi:hypothetical protein GQ43DRAFT_470097 [Delitschia confertaspora ATCC 74209]|uniref:Uncharacterized protein n=1 Tax=Delitschia confertaspora ATCC 74209 TaxID=1513339 RepID=A0A9P4JU68_9PLEO|nr:hypothetical protein GQ43DRAFT_470097 [Delitschia confertaspora ATCC 74209]